MSTECNQVCSVFHAREPATANDLSPRRVLVQGVIREIDVKHRWQDKTKTRLVLAVVVVAIVIINHSVNLSESTSSYYNCCCLRYAVFLRNYFLRYCSHSRLSQKCHYYITRVIYTCQNTKLLLLLLLDRLTIVRMS